MEKLIFLKCYYGNCYKFLKLVFCGFLISLNGKLLNFYIYINVYVIYILL